MAAKWDGCPVVACKNDLCHTGCLALAKPVCTHCHGKEIEPGQPTVGGQVCSRCGGHGFEPVDNRDDIQKLLDRVRAGSIVAAADIRERIVQGGGIGHIRDADLDRLTALVPVWRPIETAPVPPREELLHRRWRCLLLHQSSGRVLSGYGAYAQNNGSTTLVPTYALRWYADEGRLDVGPRFAATHWMPLPKGLPNPPKET